MRNLKFGVVGSRRWKDHVTVQAFVLSLLPGDTVVSGGCEGPDTWAEDQAKAMGLSITIHYPEPLRGGYNKWAKVKAYYARNRLIVESSDVIVAFVSADRTGGTENTLKHAAELGVPAFVVNMGEAIPVRDDVILYMETQLTDD